jgi:hypothetical protein
MFIKRIYWCSNVQIDKHRFVIAFLGKSHEFSDTLKGSQYWREAFGSLGSVSVFVREVRAPINIGSLITSALGLGSAKDDEDRSNRAVEVEVRIN